MLGLLHFNCHLQYFYTRPGHVLTLHFVWMWTDRNDSAVIEVFDGASPTERQLALVSVRNSTRPQSLVTTRHTIYIRFKAEARTQMIAYMKLTSGYSKYTYMIDYLPYFIDPLISE